MCKMLLGFHIQYNMLQRRKQLNYSDGGLWSVEAPPQLLLGWCCPLLVLGHLRLSQSISSRGGHFLHKAVQ